MKVAGYLSKKARNSINESGALKTTFEKLAANLEMLIKDLKLLKAMRTLDREFYSNNVLHDQANIDETRSDDLFPFKAFLPKYSFLDGVLELKGAKNLAEKLIEQARENLREFAPYLKAMASILESHFKIKKACLLLVFN